jgi:GNAT superfamily N-acetyltransferase
MSEALFRIRPIKSADENFIRNSWLKRFREAISARLVTDKVYFGVQHDVITKILAQSGLKAYAAVDPKDEDHIYGYIVAEERAGLDALLLHWVYVKGPFRRFGVARKLLQEVNPEAKSVHFTHKTHLVKFLDKKDEWTFNPVYIFALL